MIFPSQSPRGDAAGRLRGDVHGDSQLVVLPGRGLQRHPGGDGWEFTLWLFD